jgi:transient receptor potential cation channel subfamily V member 6
LNDPFGLTTAIDGMSFTHDIIMCGHDDQTEMHATIEIPGDKNNKKKKIQLKKMTTGNYNPVLAGQNAMFPVRPGQIDGQELLLSNKLQQELDQKVYNDPLRELVLISEAFVPRDTQYYNSMLILAQNATALDHVQEVKMADKLAKKSASAEFEPPITVAANIGQQIHMFQNPNEIVDPVKEREFLRTLEALDDTDNEMSERPALGKISLIRRAKSAVSRTSSGKRKTSEHPLFLMAWNEVRPVKQTAWTENDIEVEIDEHDEIIEDGVVNGDDEVANNQENEFVPVEEPVDAKAPAAESLPETFEQQSETVDAVVEEENEVVTVEDVRRRMAEFHQNRKSSADSESTDRDRKKKYPGNRQTNGKFTKNRLHS